jgi:hypothetical protein
MNSGQTFRPAPRQPRSPCLHPPFIQRCPDSCEGKIPAQGLLRGALQAWPVVALTPPPEELISAASVREARSRVQMVADRLALAGAAVVNTFVSVANGDIVVVDVNCVPDFVPGAPLLQQVRSTLL